MANFAMESNKILSGIQVDLLMKPVPVDKPTPRLGLEAKATLVLWNQ